MRMVRNSFKTLDFRSWSHQNATATSGDQPANYFSKSSLVNDEPMSFASLEPRIFHIRSAKRSKMHGTRWREVRQGIQPARRFGGSATGRREGATGMVTWTACVLFCG